MKSMRNIDPLDASILNTFPAVDEQRVDALLAAELAVLGKKIVVLDDDPTGVQTVHGISVYTDWRRETLAEAFAEDSSLFFVLTNSRAMLPGQTLAAHQEIARNLVSVSQETGMDFLLISRSDSTLRGHYPLETQALKAEVERLTGAAYDGEVICPFFKEGGRFTIDNVHYVKEGGQLTPAGQTEFARDKTFGYRASHLGEWCEEKTAGAYPAASMVYISLDDLRALNVDGIEQQLLAVEGFNKVILNAVDYCDVKVFAVALLRALAKGKRFLFRSAAAVPKVLGGVTDRPLLARAELVEAGNSNGGIVIVGSHVNKTTRQLEALRSSSYPIAFIEFNQHLVLEPGGLQREVARVIALVEEKIKSGTTVAVYTRRERFDLPEGSKEEQLQISVEISDAVTGVIAGLSARPNFIIAKGGITSSDVGTKALRVRRATVMGQIRPGIPVWMTGAESKFPHLPYIIFPGNVGEENTLREMVELLMTPAPPLLRKIDCVRLFVADLDAGLVFYRDRLGHDLIWRTPDAAGLRMPESGAEIVLQTNDRAQEVDFLVEDAAAAAERFVQAGGKIIAGPFDIQIGRCVVVQDPWGNPLVLLDTSKGLLVTDADGNVIP